LTNPKFSLILNTMNIFKQIQIYTIEYFQELWQLIVNNKTKLISILIFIIIIIPAFSLPPRDKTYIEVAQQSIENIPSIELPSINTNYNNLIPKLPAINFGLPDTSYIQEQMTPKASPLFDNITNTVATGNQIITDIDKVKDSFKVKEKIKYEGKVSWADNLKNNVYSDKFNANSSIKITSAGKSYIKNIDEKTIMQDDNLLLVSRSVFTEIGGDSKTQKSITVVVEQ
jgi:hypothetical protein